MKTDWNSKTYNLHRLNILIAIGLGIIACASSVATIFATPADGAATLGCAVKELSCTKALTSAYAQVAGIPLGVLGFFYFSFWTLLLIAYQRSSYPGYVRLISILTFLGFISSLTLGSIMFFVLKAPCLYCLITHICNIVAYFILRPVRKSGGNLQLAEEQLRHLAALAGISLLASTCLFFVKETRLAKAELNAIRMEKASQALVLDSTLRQTATLAEAIAIGKRENKPVFIEFMTSTCPHCQGLKKHIISTAAFARWANEHFATVYIYDHRARKTMSEAERKANDDLMERFVIESFPHILILGKDAALIHETSGFEPSISPQEWMRQIESAIVKEK